MVGFVVIFATFQANDVIGNDETENEDSQVEVVFLEIAPDETIECMAVDPGYAYIVEKEDDEEETDELPWKEIELNAYTFGIGGLPTQFEGRIFNKDNLGLYGHDTVELGPFSTTLPDEQIIILNTDTNDVLQVVMLENTLNNDVEVTCTIFTLVYDSTDSGTDILSVKKKKARRKVAKANKRKVKKKAAKRRHAKKKVPPR